MDKRAYYHLEIDVTDRSESHHVIQEALASEQGRLSTMYFLNAHCFNVSLADSDYNQALNRADILLNDGIGISIGARLLGFRFPDNLNGTDLIPESLNIAASLNKKAYLLGATEEVISDAATNFREKIPSLNICGYHSGFFDDDDKIVQHILDSGTDILIVGMGVPRQEKWLERNRNRLKGVKLAIAGGAIFDFTANRVVRAPVWVQKIGMEWLFRLAQEPTRLFHRYVVGNVTFLLHVITNR